MPSQLYCDMNKASYYIIYICVYLILLRNVIIVQLHTPIAIVLIQVRPASYFEVPLPYTTSCICTYVVTSFAVHFLRVNLALDLIFGISKCRPFGHKRALRFGPQRIIMCARSVSQECLPGQDPYISGNSRRFLFL